MLYEDHCKRKKIRKVQGNKTREQCGTDLTGQESYKVNMFLVIVDRLLSELSQRKTVYDKISSLFDILSLELTGVKEPFLKMSRNYAQNVSAIYRPKRVLPINVFNLLVSWKVWMKSNAKHSLISIKWSMIAVLENSTHMLTSCLDYIAMSNCSAKWSFSVMKQLKNYLRLTMMNNSRLN